MYSYCLLNFINQVHLPYHKLMTPDWLYKYATITRPFTAHLKYLEFLSGKNVYERLIQAELIAPNILTATDSIVVTLTIAMDTALANSADHDPIFGISDGTSFLGFHVMDKDNYGDHTPCVYIEGDAINKTLNIGNRDITGTLVKSRLFSSEITIQIKPNSQWGSCHTEHDEGLVNIVNYQRKLDFTKGLFLQMYRDHATEKYRIEYIAVNVDLE